MVTRNSDHIYKNEAGEIYISCTQHPVIAGLVDFSHVNPHDLAFAAQRGSFVHRAHYLYLLDDLCVDSLDKAYIGYCEAFIKFYKEQNIEAWDSENILHSDILRTGGSFDLACKFNGYGAMVEFKTSATMPKTTGLQTAAYKILWNERNPQNIITHRWGVHLLNNGKYKLHRYDNRRDEAVFKNIVNINWYALSNGIIPVGAKSNENVYNLCKEIIG